MVFFEKSQPAPESLAIEKEKKDGKYNLGDVLERLKRDFQNKCYICEAKAPTTINVEHFIPHRGNIELKFNWNNLFWCCGHCNNSKLAKSIYDVILNCTTDRQIDEKIRYEIKPFPKELPRLEAQENAPEVLATLRLLEAVYIGETPTKRMEAANLRDQLLKEIKAFQQLLENYYQDGNSEADLLHYEDQIKRSLQHHSAFTAFKKWIVRENSVFLEDFHKIL